MRAEPFTFRHYGNVPSMSYVTNKGKNVKFEIRDVPADDMPQVRRPNAQAELICYYTLFV